MAQNLLIKHTRNIHAAMYGSDDGYHPQESTGWEEEAVAAARQRRQRLHGLP